jgi:hypothetical protein
MDDPKDILWAGKTEKEKKSVKVRCIEQKINIFIKLEIKNKFSKQKLKKIGHFGRKWFDLLVIFEAPPSFKKFKKAQ